MLWTFKRAFAALGALLLMVACTDQRGPEKIAPSSEASPFEPDSSFMLLAAGRDLTDFTNEEEIADVLADVEGKRRGGDLRQRIVGLLESPIEGELQGLAGVPTRTFLKVLLLTLAEDGSFRGRIEEPKVTGQIQESVDGEPGFYFKPGEPMHVWVQMITTAKRSEESISKAEMYRVEVPANQAAVERRAGMNTSVFPGFANVAFAIPADKAERTVDDQIVRMQYKLWAVGTDVLVTDYWVDENYDPGAGPQWTKYTQATAPGKLRNIFETDAASCFDMLFVLDPTLDVAEGGALADGRLPPGTKPPYYCLGRCKHPPIVNTN